VGVKVARVFTSGGEIYLHTASAAFTPDGYIGAGTVILQAVTFRSGAKAWKCGDAGANVGGRIQFQTALSGSATRYYRIYILTTDTVSANSIILAPDATTGSNFNITMKTDGTVQLVLGNVLQGSASAALNDGLWHRIEIKAVDNGTQWTAGELRVDGVTIHSFTGATQTLGSRGFFAGFVLATSGTNKFIYVDDVAMNDSTGSVNNDWCGPGKVVLLRPISDNARGTGWTTDSAGTTNFFNCEDNTPPAGIADTVGGAGTSQIRNATANANSDVDLDMTSYSTAGISTSDMVRAVTPIISTAAPVVTAAKQGEVGVVSNPTITNLALSSTGTAGAFWQGVAGGTFPTGWKWSFGTISENPAVTVGTSPVMRVRQVTSSTRIAVVDFMGMYVDYTPSSSLHPTHYRKIRHLLAR
jgi:hypothetical protein